MCEKLKVFTTIIVIVSVPKPVGRQAGGYTEELIDERRWKTTRIGETILWKEGGTNS